MTEKDPLPDREQPVDGTFGVPPRVIDGSEVAVDPGERVSFPGQGVREYGELPQVPVDAPQQSPEDRGPLGRTKETDAQTAGSESAGLAALRRRTLVLLTIGQVLGGLGMGAGLSVGALAVSDLVGASWSGLAATMSTLGAAVLALPLARLADARGRRLSLTTAALVAALGALGCLIGITVAVAPLLFVGLVLIGAATAAALQSRFAATDLAEPATRGRDLSLVVWSTTIGAVTGPNLAEPGDVVGAALGLAPLAGVFLFPLVTQLVAALLYAAAMRPDPLLESRRLALLPASGSRRRPLHSPGMPQLVRLALVTLALSHATMVALMSMTPVHLVHGGATLSVVGFVISLHVAGMFALSPLFGILADRIGPVPVIVAGQLTFLAAALVAGLGHHHRSAVLIGLILLGLAWSASTVAGSTLLTVAAPSDRAVVLQGRSDLAMNGAGAVGGALSGPVFAYLDYPGLSFLLVLPVAVVLGVALVSTRRSDRRPMGLSGSPAG